jgi:hypothetical protein
MNKADGQGTRDRLSAVVANSTLQRAADAGFDCVSHESARQAAAIFKAREGKTLF